MPETRQRPRYLDSVSAAADAIIDTVGTDIRLGVPLGLGKPVQLVNELYRRACADPQIRLTILTALTLQRPTEKEPLRRRLLEPVFERIYGGCPELDYAGALDDGELPDNVVVREFYFRPGSRVNNGHAQRNYISSNYTHAARDVFANGCNVAMQMVARRRDENGETRLSMSCNPDTTLQLAQMLRESDRPHVIVAVVNQQLPFMYGDAEVAPGDYDIVVDNERDYTPLFATPKLMPVSTPDYMIGLQASALVSDGGTLQLGIGALGDAIVHGLCLRQRDNAAYREALESSGIASQAGELIGRIGGTAPFDRGLFGATEMFVEGFLHLLEAGILKREVYDFWALQQLINDGRCRPDALGPDVLEGMAELGVREIRTKDFEVLRHHGLFNERTAYERGHITAPDGTRVQATLGDPHTRRVLADQCLGAALENGKLLQGGFFLGSNDFYRALREMPAETRRKIDMTGVYKINQLDHNPRLYKAQRIDARFINTGMNATLNGAVSSDTLDNGQVISGVGGQYNFVAMAHQLPGGRSVLMIRAVRDKGGRPVSNIVWNYGACTIPRHLRDIVVTEYGIADLRSRSDAEVAKALIAVADSRFQGRLLEQAKAAGKIEADYRLPERCRNNTPERLESVLAPLRRRDLFPAYPFGCDFTEEELLLAKALRGLAARRDAGWWRNMRDAAAVASIPSEAQVYLDRMGLREPATLRDRLLRRLLVLELKRVGALGRRSDN